MNSFLGKLKNAVLSINLRDIIFVLVIGLLLILLSVAVNKCSSIKHQYENNIKAMNDTIRYYESENGNLVATKLAFESDIKGLKMLNESLYDHIKDLKAKGDITNGTYFGGIIEIPKHDTTYVINHDTVQAGFTKNFAFGDQYHQLEGNVSYKNSLFGINIEKNRVFFDYTVAMDDENNIMISSSNPYVQYKEITGFQVPKQKKKHFSIGPSINFGYDPIKGKPTFSIGASATYGLFQW